MIFKPLIVDLGFLYLKLSQVFYWQYSLKKFKSGVVEVVATRSNGDLKPLSGISKSQTWVFVLQIQDRIVRGFGVARGSVSKFYKR